MAQPFWKTAGQSLTKLNILLPYNPATALFGIYPKELKTCPRKNMHMDFYSSFIQNRQNLEASKTSSLDEWINCGTPKQWDITQCFKKHLLSCKKTWEKLKCVLLRERNQSEIATCYKIPTVLCSGKGKTMETVKR